jgi:hypothetical protein
LVVDRRTGEGSVPTHDRRLEERVGESRILWQNGTVEVRAVDILVDRSLGPVATVVSRTHFDLAEGALTLAQHRETAVILIADYLAELGL